MVMRVIAACSLIVVRCCWMAAARYMLSSLFSPVTFLRYSFASFGARSTLIALHCSNFDSLLLTTPFLLFGCLLLAVRFFFSLLSCRFSLLALLVLAAYYLLHPARYYLLATHCPTVASVFSPQVS